MFRNGMASQEVTFKGSSVSWSDRLQVDHDDQVTLVAPKYSQLNRAVRIVLFSEIQTTLRPNLGCTTLFVHGH